MPGICVAVKASMAKQIGTFFASQPDHNEALEGIANHIKKFWEPRMRHALWTVIDDSGAGLLPIVSEALRQHRSMFDS